MPAPLKKKSDPAVPLPSNHYMSHIFTSVCWVPGEEVSVVCLLGRPWHSVLRRPRNGPAHLPALSGKTACWCGANTSTLTSNRSKSKQTFYTLFSDITLISRSWVQAVIFFFFFERLQMFPGWVSRNVRMDNVALLSAKYQLKFSHQAELPK